MCLTAFKARLRANRGMEVLEQILREIVKMAQEKGVVFGSVQVVDSVHTVAKGGIRLLRTLFFNTLPFPVPSSP